MYHVPLSPSLPAGNGLAPILFVPLRFFYAPATVITFPDFAILLATTAPASQENPFGAPSESVMMSIPSLYARRRASIMTGVAI